MEYELKTVPGLEDGIPIGMIAVGAVDEEGEVVSCVGIYPAPHLSPLWIREDHRKSPTILRRVWETLKQELYDRDIHDVEIGLLEHDPGPEHEADVVRIITDLAGGEEVKARTFVIHLE